MEIRADYLDKFNQRKEGAPRSEREELLTKFLTRLNESRPRAGFKPMTYGRLARMFHGVPDGDLYPFYKTCEEARSFGAMFWHCLKKR